MACVDGGAEALFASGDRERDRRMLSEYLGQRNVVIIEDARVFAVEVQSAQRFYGSMQPDAQDGAQTEFGGDRPVCRPPWVTANLVDDEGGLLCDRLQARAFAKLCLHLVGLPNHL